MEAENIPEEQPDDLTAAQILKRVGEVYATCSTYEDAGVVETLSVSENRRKFVVTPFTTVFERPNRFRIECTRDKERHIVWASGSKVKTSWNVFRLSSRFNPLGLLLYPLLCVMWLLIRLFLLFPENGRLHRMLMLGNIAGDAASTIPALLMPDEFHRQRMTEILEAIRLEDRVLDDVACFCLQGKIWPYTVLLWIDRATFRIRRVDQQGKYSWAYMEKTITYYSLVNQPIDPQKFEFRPSRKRAD